MKKGYFYSVRLCLSYIGTNIIYMLPALAQQDIKIIQMKFDPSLCPVFTTTTIIQQILTEIITPFLNVSGLSLWHRINA